MAEQVKVTVERRGNEVETKTKMVDADSDVEVEINEVEPDEYVCSESDDCDFKSESKTGIKSHEAQAH